MLLLPSTAPKGKPELIVAHNTSSSSIYLSWRPPAVETIFGEFLGYRIIYHPRDSKPENVNEIWLRENTVEVSEFDRVRKCAIVCSEETTNHSWQRAIDISSGCRVGVRVRERREMKMESKCLLLRWKKSSPRLSNKSHFQFSSLVAFCSAIDEHTVYLKQGKPNRNVWEWTTPGEVD